MRQGVPQTDLNDWFLSNLSWESVVKLWTQVLQRSDMIATVPQKLVCWFKGILFTCIFKPNLSEVVICTTAVETHKLLTFYCNAKICLCLKLGGKRYSRLKLQVTRVSLSTKHWQHLWQQAVDHVSFQLKWRKVVSKPWYDKVAQARQFGLLWRGKQNVKAGITQSRNSWLHNKHIINLITTAS